MGHTGGLITPRPWRERCRAGYSNTGGPPLPRKREKLQNCTFEDIFIVFSMLMASCEILPAWAQSYTLEETLVSMFLVRNIVNTHLNIKIC